MSSQPDEKAPNRSEQSEGKAIQKTESQASKKPAGGYDGTPIPRCPPGYTVKITIHRATHLPIADLTSTSSDPYMKFDLDHGLPTRHKEDPPMRFRTRTIWSNTNPEWNEEWTVANMPASGFRLKGRVFDEDQNDRDDRLGNIHVSTGEISESWAGIHNQAYQIEKRSGSWRAYALRSMAACMRRNYHINAYVHLSIEVLGKTPGDDGGHAYTIGRNYWCKNFSPILGRIANNREPDDDHQAGAQNEARGTSDASSPDAEKQNKRASHAKSPSGDHHKQTGHYSFQSSQFQLQGPVPPELYHRYVEFKPFVSSMFTGKGLRGIILNKALHHQHTAVYNFNKDTRYGMFDGPCRDMTLKFLELAHWDKGGRIHTYVITLDGLMRFTETGKEFRIDLLSKHTMHSDVDIYIAFSGEFFIRRRRRTSSKPASPNNLATAHDAQSSPPQPNTPSSLQPSGEAASPHEETLHDPSYYELVIDNDSGTYRPNAQMLPKLREFLQRNFPGLRIITLDCQKDEALMNKLKKQQRERKKHEAGGQRVVYTQADDDSSSSSDDEERLDALADEESAEGPRHRLGEALGPFTLDHPTARRIIGAGG